MKTSEMSSRERVLCTLRCQPPDRVPIGEFVIDPKIIAGFNPNYRDVVDFALAEGIDAVGAVAHFATTETRSDGSFIDEWGCLYGKSPEVTSHPIAGPIPAPRNLDGFAWPDPDAPHRLGNLPALVEKAQGRVAINFHCRVAFMWSIFLMGMDNLLMTMALDPGFAHVLFHRVADLNIQVIRRAIRAGADTVSLGDDYCSNRGSLMSPAMFCTFLLPHLQRAVVAIHEEGARCVKHCDGYLWPILDDMVDTGIDAINPLEPVARMDIGAVKARYGQRVCIWGNIDCGELLCHGTTEEVDQAVRTCIEAGAPGGGLVISSSNSIHSGVNVENYKAMIHAAHRYGTYPLESLGS